jgi:hypothetical protein
MSPALALAHATGLADTHDDSVSAILGLLAVLAVAYLISRFLRLLSRDSRA